MQHQRIIDKHLEELKEKLLNMGAAVENVLQLAIKSLVQRDVELARKVIETDKLIDDAEIDIDCFCIETLALYQPAAHDLRFVIAAAKITPILERIADHSTSIAEATVRISKAPVMKDYLNIPSAAQKAGEMLKNALQALTSEDAELAREIIKKDKEIDLDYKITFDGLLKQIIENPQITTTAAQLLFVAKHLERIGDYIKDICELTVYMKEAVFIKHHGENKV